MVCLVSPVPWTNCDCEIQSRGFLQPCVFLTTNTRILNSEIERCGRRSSRIALGTGVVRLRDILIVSLNQYQHERRVVMSTYLNCYR